jgi:hypothetical protein
MSVARLFISAVAATVAAGVSAGCGGGRMDNAAPAATPSATPAPLDLGFASFTFRLTQSDGEVVQGTGSFRNAPSPMTELTLDQLVVDGRPVPGVTVLRTRTATYVHSADWAKSAPFAADRWFSLTEKTSWLDVQFLELLGSYEGMSDPYEQLQMLQSGAVETVGPETVDDVATVHKRSTATFAQVWENPRVSHKIRDGLRAAGLTEEAFETPNTFDAWLDGNGRVVKFELSDPSAGSAPMFVTTATFDEARAAALAEPAQDLVIDAEKFQRLKELTAKLRAGKATGADVAEGRRLTKQLGLDRAQRQEASRTV